jgi:hypothetical protein
VLHGTPSSIDEARRPGVMARAMADYNLNGLNPRDFQHLVQALATALCKTQPKGGVNSTRSGANS